MCRRLLAVLVAVAGMLLLGPAFAWAATPSPAPVPTATGLYAPGAWSCSGTDTAGGLTGPTTVQRDCAVTRWSRVGTGSDSQTVNISCTSAGSSPSPSPSASPASTGQARACGVVASLDSRQYVPLLVMAGVALLVGLAAFVVTHGRPWRV